MPLELIPLLIPKGQKFQQVLPPELETTSQNFWKWQGCNHTQCQNQKLTGFMKFYKGRLTSNLPWREEHLKYKSYDSQEID